MAEKKKTRDHFIVWKRTCVNIALRNHDLWCCEINERFWVSFLW